MTHNKATSTIGRQAISGYDEYGGWLALPLPNPSGYFTTATADGRSWLVTPAGHAYFSLGVGLFGFGNRFNFPDTYDRTIIEQYRGDAGAWAAASANQLRGWGFNTIGGFSGAEVRHRGLAETRVLGLAGRSINYPYNSPRVNNNFPDVFDPGWPGKLQLIVSEVVSESDRTDRWLLGYFLDNELYWFKAGYFTDTATSTLTEDYITLSRTAAGKRAWVDFLVSRYGIINQLNQAWGSSYSSFYGEEATSLLNATTVPQPTAIADKFAFVEVVATQYYRLTTAAVHGRDPNHLILGDRYLGTLPAREVVAAAGQYVDVVSINLYPRAGIDNPNLTNLDEAARAGKPVLISEFSFHTSDAGMPNVPLGRAGLLANERERAAAYQTLLGEALRHPAFVGAHWFMQADRAVLDSSRRGGYYGHFNWGLLDINNRPYSIFTGQLTAYHTGIYERKLGQPSANPEPPITLNPAYDAPVFEDDLVLRWRAVAGIGSYKVQLARQPDFFNPQQFTVNDTALKLTTALGEGRWYWRVRAVSVVADSLAYTSPQPFYVLRQTASLPLVRFETQADVTLEGAGPDYGWTAETTGAVTLAASFQRGVVEGQRAGQLTYSGLTVGQSDHYSWAYIHRHPQGTAFTPRDWSSYNYLTADLTAAGSNLPRPFVALNFGDDAGKQGIQALPLREATIRFALSIDEAVARGLNPRQIADLSLGLLRPEPQQQLYVDNIVLRRVAPVGGPQPAISPVVNSAQRGSTLDIDWRGYRPASTTVAYYVYVTDQPGVPISALQPAVRLDAVAQRTFLRFLYAPGRPEADPYGYNLLVNGQTYYITVVAVDRGGNLGAIAPAVVGVPTECNLAYNDVPPDYWAYHFISHLTCLGIANGVGNGNFNPGGAVTRGQITKFLTLARGWPLVEPVRPTFSDVPPGTTFYPYVETAYAHGAINGATAQTCAGVGSPYPCFLPDVLLNRAQLAIILLRAYGWSPNIGGGPHFSDVPPDYYAYAAIETCYNRQIMTGVGGGRFAPNQPLTRAEVCKIIYQALPQTPLTGLVSRIEPNAGGGRP